MREQETPSYRESARGHWWASSSPLEGGARQPTSVLSGAVAGCDRFLLTSTSLGDVIAFRRYPGNNNLNDHEGGALAEFERVKERGMGVIVRMRGCVGAWVRGCVGAWMRASVRVLFNISPDLCFFKASYYQLFSFFSPLSLSLSSGRLLLSTTRA